MMSRCPRWHVAPTSNLAASWQVPGQPQLTRRRLSRPAGRWRDVCVAVTRRKKAAPSDAPPSAEVGVAQEFGTTLLESMPGHLRITDDFSPTLTRQLRAEFELKMGNPRETRPERFVWDWWHVPGQYTQLRTPAHDFFDTNDLYAQLESSLLDYGRRELGCSAVSPIWLSMYISGCSQELHADVPHGPFAFVLSLSPKKRSFTGGETFILQPQVLDYWRDFQPGAVTEERHLATRLKPDFSRLTVFDARFPHGVTRVEGTMDPLKARLVLHGWFLEPTPFFEGSLTEDDATDALTGAMQPLFEALADEAPASGVLVVRIYVAKDGAVTDIRALSDTLRPHPGCGDVDEARTIILRLVHEHLSPATFPAAQSTSQITLPLVFE